MVWEWSTVHILSCSVAHRNSILIMVVNRATLVSSRLWFEVFNLKAFKRKLAQFWETISFCWKCSCETLSTRRFCVQTHKMYDETLFQAWKGCGSKNGTVWNCSYLYQEAGRMCFCDVEVLPVSQYSSVDCCWMMKITALSMPPPAPFFTNWKSQKTM